MPRLSTSKTCGEPTLCTSGPCAAGALRLGDHCATVCCGAPLEFVALAHYNIRLENFVLLEDLGLEIGLELGLFVGLVAASM
jgi:hypothetical protein